MPKVAKKKIKFDEESLNNICQEIYNDQFNHRARLSLLFKEWGSKAKTIEDINIIGAQILKILDLEGKNIEQKLGIGKLIKDVIKENKNAENSKNKSSKDNSQDGEGSENTITTFDRDYLLNFIEENKTK